VHSERLFDPLGRFLTTSTVSREFQPHPSLMARSVSLEIMRLLRLDQDLSASLQEVRQNEAFLSNYHGALNAAQSSIHNSISPLALSHQWASMASPPLSQDETRRQLMFAPLPSLVTPPAPLAQSHWSMLGHGAFGTPQVNQYLHQQQTFHRECARQGESVMRGSSAFTSPSPVVLSCSADEVILSKFQVFLRQHVEAFAATNEDKYSPIRGRNKPVLLHQVGIRCRHCAHISANRRTKGSVYFPSTTMGIYQAAQNMSTMHLQCGLCPEMPESTKTMFAQLIGTKTTGTSSAGGRTYWGRCAQQMGLVDTEKGVFLVGSIPEGIEHIVDST
jgi:hypothetical protein